MFTIAAAHKIDVIGKLWVAYWPSTNGDGCAVVIECFLMIFSGNKLNRMSKSKHPWQTATVVLRNSPSCLFKRTALLEFSFSA